MAQVSVNGRPSAAELAELLGRHVDALLPPIYRAAPERVVAHFVRAWEGCDALIGARRGDRLCGVAAFRRAAFEEQFFQMRCADVGILLADGDPATAGEVYDGLLSRLWSIARERSIPWLSCSIPVENVAARHALERNGFRLMDTKIEYVWTPALVRSQRTSFGYTLHAGASEDELPEALRLLMFGTVLRPFEPRDLAALRALAAEAFTQRTRTRFAVDSDLDAAAVERFYAAWVENASVGAFADVFMVAASEGVPVGFQVLREERALSDGVGVAMAAMGIGAVVRDARGQGAFPALLTELLEWSRQRGLRFVRGGVLVNNLGMHRSCVATGATVAACHHTFHGRAAARSEA